MAKLDFLAATSRLHVCKSQPVHNLFNHLGLLARAYVTTGSQPLHTLGG